MKNTQNTETPWEFVRAVENYFGIKFKYDMAASTENAKAPIFFTEQDDSLNMDWPLDGWCWLNPQFRNVGEWAKKCKEQKDRGASVISIWPLTSEKNNRPSWKYSNVFVIHGRIWKNVRGCMLCLWSAGSCGNVNSLEWNKKTGTLKEV